MTRYWIPIALWLLPSFCPAQTPEATSVPTFTLSLGEAHKAATPLFSSSSHYCDAQGNVLFSLFAGEVDAGNFLRISRNGQDVTKLPLPVESSNPGEWHAAVSPDGSLYLEYSAIKEEEEKHTLFEISSTGKETSRSSLQLPFGFHPVSFAVLEDGRSMFFGSIQTDGSDTEAPWMFWFDPAGRLISKRQSGKPFDRMEEHTDTVVTAGSPGTFVAVTAKEIRVFDTRGEILQTFPVPSPPTGSFANFVQFLDGKIAVEFQYPVEEIPTVTHNDSSKSSPPIQQLNQTWLLLNALTGEAEAFYESPPDFSGSSLCYLGRHSFLYLTVKDRIPAFVEANE